MGFGNAQGSGGAGGVTNLTDLGDVTAKSGTGTVVLMQGSPAPTTPTVADLSNMNHDHSNAAGGGAVVTNIRRAQLVYHLAGEQAVGADAGPPLRPSGAFTITEVYIEAGTGPAGADMVIDVNKNGTTIFTTQANRPTISDGGTTGTSGTPDVTSLAKDDAVTVDVDQVGSGTAGSDVTVHVRGTIS